MPESFDTKQIPSSTSLIVVALIGLLHFADSAFAQQVATDPSSTHIFPAGGRRGTRVDVRVGTECAPPSTRFRMFGEGVTVPAELGDHTTSQSATSPRRKPSEQPVTHPKEWQSQVEIAADAPAGVKLWRLSCARGGTGARPFIVGELPEFIETEPNSLPSEAERVELPVTINGQISGEGDLDYFRFDVKAGAVVHAEVMSARLGSALDPIVQVFGPDGQRIVADEERVGADPILAFRAATSGEYRFLISNVTLRGGPQFVYRVTLTHAPLVRFAYPAGGQVGTAREIDFFALSGDGTLSVLREKIAFPATVGDFSQPGPSGANALPFSVSDLFEDVESEGNNSRETASELTCPLVMNGQFGTADDEDWFRIECRKDIPLSIECLPQPHWSPSLPIINVTDANGGVLTSASAVQTSRGIVHVDWQPPADGVYFLRLRDLQHGIRGGPEFIYRLIVREAVPDFYLTLKADVINVVQGERVDVDIVIDRRSGFIAPIDLSVEGLPEGVRVEGLQIASGLPTAKLTFIADPDARSCDVTLRIKGKVDINGRRVEHHALARHLGHDVDGIGIASADVDHLQLTVVHKPVFKLYCNEAYQYAHRGTIYPYLMELERLNGFDGPIHLEVADRQIKDLDGIEILETTVAPSVTQVMLPLNLPETMHINVQAHSNVYSQAHVQFLDKFGQKQTMLVVSTMRCMIRTLPTVARLRAESRELTASKSGTVTCGLILDRTSHFTGLAKILLLDADMDVFAEPGLITSDQTRTELVVHLTPSAMRQSPRTLSFRAVGEMPGGVQVVSEAKVLIKFAD